MGEPRAEAIRAALIPGRSVLGSRPHKYSHGRFDSLIFTVFPGAPVSPNMRTVDSLKRIFSAATGNSHCMTLGPGAVALSELTSVNPSKRYRVVVPWPRYASANAPSASRTRSSLSWSVKPLSTAAGICTGAAAQKCTTGSVVACPCSPWEGPARGATRPRRGWRRPARGRGLWAHGDKRGVIRTVAGVVTGSA